MSDDDAAKEASGKALIEVSVSDVAGLGKGIRSLTDAVSRGIGAALQPWLEARLAKTEQANTKGWVKVATKAGLTPQAMELETIEGRTRVRLLAQQVKQQGNREAVAFASLQEAAQLHREGARIDDAQIDPEWESRFWRIAQDISREELQSLWGRLLARKATGTGEVSARTLESLSLLESDEIELLTGLAPITIYTSDRAMWLYRFTATQRSSNYADIQALSEKLRTMFFGFDAQHMASIGLAASPSGFADTFALPGAAQSATQIVIAGSYFELLRRESGHEREELSIGEVQTLSRTGEEIIQLIRVQPNAEFMQLFRMACSAKDVWMRSDTERPSWWRGESRDIEGDI